MTFALARSLLLADAVKTESLAQALLLSATRGTSLVRALLAIRAIDPMRLEQHLEHGDAPTMRHVAPVMSLVQHLPPGLCERLLALPVRRDPRTGTVDVAVVDARDTHAVDEIAYWLRAPVRMVRTSLASMDAALRRIHVQADPGVRPLAAPIWVPAPRDPPRRQMARTPVYGVPVYDADRTAEPLESDEDSSPTEVMDFPAAAPNIPFTLTRKSVPPPEIVELGAPAVEVEKGAPTERDPVLDLRRRKSLAPFSANAPALPFEDVGPVLDEIRAAGDRDAILELLVKGVRTAARRAGVLAVRRDVLAGWTCSPELAERAAFRAVRLPHDGTALAPALEGDGAHLVRLPKDATHAPLLAAMKAPPSGEAAIVAVRVDDKAVAVVLAHELGDTLLVTRRMEELARAAGESLARLLRERRK